MVARSEPFRSLFDGAGGADVAAAPRVPDAGEGPGPVLAGEGHALLAQRLDQLVLAGGVTPPRGLMPRLADLRPIAPVNRSDTREESTSTAVRVHSIEGPRARPALWRPKPAAAEATPGSAAPILPASLSPAAPASFENGTATAVAPTVFGAILAAHSSDQEPTRRVNIRGLVASAAKASEAAGPATQGAAIAAVALHVADGELAADPQRAVTLPGRAPRGTARRAPPPEDTAASDVAGTPERAVSRRFASIGLSAGDEAVTAVDAVPALLAPFQSGESAENADVQAAPSLVEGSGKRPGRYRLRPELSTTSSRPLPILATVLPLPFDDDDEAGTVVDVHPAHGSDGAPTGRWHETEPSAGVDARARGIFATTLESVADVLSESASLPGGEAPDLDANAFAGDDITVVSTEMPGRAAPVGHAAPGAPARLLASAASDDGDSVFTNIRPPAPSTVAAVTAVAPHPVIVRIPSRQQATPRAQAKAREHYLAAVDYLARGDKKAAMGNLRLALHYDENAVLYRDLLAQLQKSSGEGLAVKPGHVRR